MHKPWFKISPHGVHGQLYPSSKEGWLVIALYVLDLGLIVFFDKGLIKLVFPNVSASADILLGIVIFIVIYFFKAEKPRLKK